MTLIAGIVSRKSKSIPDSIRQSLIHSISRNDQDKIEVFSDSYSCLTKLDIGAFGESGVVIDREQNISLLAGEPLLNVSDGGVERTRHQDLQMLHEQFTSDEWKLLQQSSGTFCIAHYQPRSRKLFLLTDKLGIRPLYYWVDQDFLVFATAIRILEGLSLVPKRMDVEAVTEIVALGIPLADRTPYADLFCLEAARILEVTDSSTSQRQYSNWDDLSQRDGSEEQHLAEVYKSFTEGVRRRIRNDKTAVAYLSGGLDSRCVVAALAAQGVKVHTFNFARPGTQDQVFGDDFAHRLGTLHSTVPKEPGDRTPDYSSIMAKAWEASKYRERHPVNRPNMVWSGEGGSVLLGHIHMIESIVARLRAGQLEGAIDEYLDHEQIYVPIKFLTPKMSVLVKDLVKNRILDELHKLQSNDAGRRFYLFLMGGDQRRKLFNHFENLDLHRLEFQLPFFDSEFIASVIRTPLDLCLRHKFYVKWLNHFPIVAKEVPWQSYPGHEPCPVKFDSNLSYQWGEAVQTKDRETNKIELLREASELLRAKDFPGELLSKTKLRIATWAHSRGLRDYEYVIKAAETYFIYWRKCGGLVSMSSKA